MSKKKGFALLDVAIGLFLFTVATGILFGTLFQHNRITASNSIKLYRLIAVSENIDRNFENNWDEIEGKREAFGNIERITFEGFTIEKKIEP